MLVEKGKVEYGQNKAKAGLERMANNERKNYERKRTSLCC